MSVLVTLSSSTVQVDPGSEATITARVRNTGSVVNRYTIAVLGVPGAWTLAEPAVLPLFPSVEGEVTLRFTPPRAPEPAAGLVPFGVKVTSSEDPDDTAVEEGTVQVRPFSSVSIRLAPRNARAALAAHYRLLVENFGNSAENVGVAAADPDENLEFGVHPDRVELGPGLAGVVRMKVRPRRVALAGAAESRPFQVSVNPGSSPPVTADGTLVQRALVSNGVIMAVIGLLALSLLGANQVAPLLVGQKTTLGDLLTGGGPPSDVTASPAPGATPATTATPPQGGGQPTPSPSAAPANLMAAWGANGNGQLGLGSNQSLNTPRTLGGFTGVNGLASGAQHTLALRSDGSVWAWGGNAFGQLGTGNTTPSLMPVKVPGLPGVKAIAAGYYHSLALANDGTLWGWGHNYYGELGVASPTQVLSPMKIPFFSQTLVAKAASPVVVIPIVRAGPNPAGIATGGYHSLVLDRDGTVWAMGLNNLGQVGTGTTSLSVTTPTRVQGLTGVNSLAGGGNFSLALTTDGSVWAWGDNSHGQLGIEAPPPRQLSRSKPVLIIPITQKSTPSIVYGLSQVTAIGAGAAYSVALKQDGSAWTWGYGGAGQLGNGSTSDLHQPGQVKGPGSSGLAALSAGAQHVLGVKSDGSVIAWGANAAGELGDGSTQNASTPVAIKVGFTVLRATAGFDFSLALAK